MFNLRIVKAETLNKLQADLANQQRVTSVLKLRLDNLADQAERNNKAVNNRFRDVERNAALTNSKVCPLLTAVPKHVVDPMGAWESKQRVLEQRLKSAVADVCMFECQALSWYGLNYELAAFNTDLRNKTQVNVERIKQELYEHSTRKPIVVQLAPPSETAVVVYHKKYGTKGLLKGNHITILSKGNQLNVGDVILNATPAVVHKFWNIAPEVVEVSVRV